MQRVPALPAQPNSAMQPVYHPQVVPLGPATSSAACEQPPAAASQPLSSLAVSHAEAVQTARSAELREAAPLFFPPRLLALDSTSPTSETEAQEEKAAASWAAFGSQQQQCRASQSLPDLPLYRYEQQQQPQPQCFSVKTDPAAGTPQGEEDAAAACPPPPHDDAGVSFSSSSCSTLSPPSSSYPMWDSRPPSPSDELSPVTQASNRSSSASASSDCPAAVLPAAPAGDPASSQVGHDALSPLPGGRDDALFAASSPAPQLGRFLLSAQELQLAVSEQLQAGAGAADIMEDIERCSSSSSLVSQSERAAGLPALSAAFAFPSYPPYFALTSDDCRTPLLPTASSTWLRPCAARSSYQLCVPALPILSTGAVMEAEAAGVDGAATFCLSHQCDHAGGVAVDGGCFFSSFTAPLLRSMHSRTIAARLTEGSTGSDAEDERPIIVSQQPEEPQQPQLRKRSRGARRSAKSKKRRGRVGGNKENSASRHRPRQGGGGLCEHCNTRAADAEYGTGRFCGAKCARTFSIAKRYAKVKERLQAKEGKEQSSAQADRVAAARRRSSISSAPDAASSSSAAPSTSSVASSPATAESDSSGDEEQPGAPSGCPALADDAADVNAGGFADVSLCCYCGAACGSEAVTTMPSGQFCNLRCANLLAQHQKDCEGVNKEQEAAAALSNGLQG